MKYGLICTLQWEYYGIDVFLPLLWDDSEKAKSEELKFFLDSDGISFSSHDGISGLIKSDEWWKYRISVRRDDCQDKLVTSVEDYIPFDSSLETFLPYVKGNGERLLQYSLSYLSYNVYF